MENLSKKNWQCKRSSHTGDEILWSQTDSYKEIAKKYNLQPKKSLFQKIIRIFQ